MTAFTGETMRKFFMGLSLIGLLNATVGFSKAELPKDITLTPTVASIGSDNIKKLPDIQLSTNNDNVSVTFDTGNFFQVTTSFSEKLLDDFSEQLMSYEKKEMIIYFDSPGGSVFAMSRIIGLMQSSKVKFICVARFAASAAFNMFEACDKRYLLSDGILMSHEWSGGFRDEAPRILTLFNAINDLVHDVELMTVSKLNIKMEEYKNLINKNLWMTKTLATKYGAIDGVVNDVKCTKELTDQRIEKNIQQMGLFGPVNQTVILSGCPLISKIYGVIKDKKTLYPAINQIKDKMGTHSIIYELKQKLDGIRLR